MKKETRRRMYFWHATRQLDNDNAEHSFGSFSAKSVGPEFVEEVKSVIERYSNWPTGSFVIDTLSFLGEYDHETR